MNSYQLLLGYRDRLLAGDVDPVVIGPLQGTGRCVGLTYVPLVDDMTSGNVLAGVQVRIRGAAGEGVQPVLDRQDAILALLAVDNTTVGDQLVVTCWRQNSAPLGNDPQGRPEVFDTYYLRTDRLGRA